MKHDWMFIIVSFVAIVSITVWFTYPIEMLTDLFDLFTLENVIGLIVSFVLWVFVFMISIASHNNRQQIRKDAE